MAKSHAEILSDIASQVARQYTTGTGGKFTTSQDTGQVPVPVVAGHDTMQHDDCILCGTSWGHIDPSWDWTLDVAFQDAPHVGRQHPRNARNAERYRP